MGLVGIGSTWLCLRAVSVLAQAAPAPSAQQPPSSPTSSVSSTVSAPTPAADWGERLSTSRPATPLEAVPPAPKSATKSEPPSALAIPIVQGYDSFGLSIPDLDPLGHLRSLFVIGAVSRVDDRSVEIRDSFLETYHEDGSRDFSIDLPKATLDRFTRVLVAQTPVTIRRDEFELHGATMEFNTATREGGLGGPVEMIIYNGFGDEPVAEPTAAKVSKDNKPLAK